MFRTPSAGAWSSQALRKLLQGGRGEVMLYTSLQQRELAVWTAKIRHQAKEFSILCMGRCNPHSFHVHLGYRANSVSFILLLAFPQLFSKMVLESNTHCGISLGSSHSHLEARNHWWLWYFLLINMAGDVFISQSRPGDSEAHWRLRAIALQVQVKLMIYQ